MEDGGVTLTPSPAEPGNFTFCLQGSVGEDTRLEFPLGWGFSVCQVM
jgi:hypothetical protein